MGKLNIRVCQCQAIPAPAFIVPARISPDIQHPSCAIARRLAGTRLFPNMSELSDLIPAYIGSEHFLLLDADLKQNAEPLLSLWCEAVGDDASPASVDGALMAVAQAEAPVEQRRDFPGLLMAFLNYVDESAHFAAAPQWLRAGEHASKHYGEGFRADGTFRGETIRKPVAAVGRNEPCPCGSGRKFKKCCMT